MTELVIERVKPPKRTLNLQEVLADLISLSLQAKQAHWNVTGPRFIPLHQLLDAFADAYRQWSDDVAERLRALRAPADGRTAELVRTSRVLELPGGEIVDEELIELFLDRVEDMAGRTRGMIETLESQDPVTQGMLVEIVGRLEKQAWMLRVQRRSHD